MTIDYQMKMTLSKNVDGHQVKMATDCLVKA